MSHDTESLKFISNEEVGSLLDWDDLLPAIEDVLGRYSRGDSSIILPVRTSFVGPTNNSTFYAMPCYSGKEDVFCTKLLAVSPTSRERGLPGHRAFVMLFNGTTAQPLAMLAGEELTARRTAAASAVATKLLVNGTPKIIAILGAGVEARSHFQVLHHLYPHCEVKIWNIRESSGRKLLEEIKMETQNATLCGSVKETVKGADIICTTTNTATPILKAEWVKPGAHINAVGACRATLQEIDSDLMMAATVYVDCSKAAKQESGNILKSGATIYGEIGEVINGTKEALRGKTTLFDSLGIAIEDAVAANIVCKKHS